MHHYESRMEALRQQLLLLNCDALLIEYPINLLYLTGIELSTGKLLVTQQNTLLLVDGRYIEICRQHSPYAVLLLDQMPMRDWIIQNDIRRLAFESDKTSYQNFEVLNQTIQEISSENYCELIPVKSPVEALRMIKDPYEIELLTQAAQLGYEGYELVASLLKEGISEEELAFELEFFWKKRGGKKLAFDPIIAFGANGAMPHYRAGSTTLKKGMSVLIDIGVTWKHYQSDMTRVIFFGEPDPLIATIYSIVEEAKSQALLLCKPGTLIGELDKAARLHISSKGYGDYFTHSLGHGIGLETHEPPTLRSKGPYADVPLKAGMTITIEPGIYLPQQGGVRLEDTILITEQGYKNLTQR